MVCGVGINDMPRGWTEKNELNKRIYKTWGAMIRRCYSQKSLEKHPSYKNCIVCDRWLKLSNFVEDITKITNYDLWLNNKGLYVLDKDIKSNGKCKIYCLENCMFVTTKQNAIQSTSTRDYTFGENHPLYGKQLSEETKEKISKAMKGKQRSEEIKQKISEAMKGKYCGENHPNSIKIRQEDKQGNLIKIWNTSREVEREMGINQGHVIACCKWYACGEDLEEWYKTHKSRPYKSVGGYIWKYIREE